MRLKKLNKIYRLIKRYLKKIFKFLAGGSRSKSRNWLMIYLIGLLPSNYITTALTTSSSLTDPHQIMQVMQKTEAFSSIGGIFNTVTGGFLRPVVNGITNISGHAIESVGQTFNMSGMINTGKKWVDGSKKWFEAGLNVSSNTSSNAQNAMNSSNRELLAQWGYNEYNATNFYLVDGLASQQRDFGDSEDMFSRAGNEGLFEYGEGDELGRTTTAKAIVTWESISRSAGTREEFEKGSNPSGWPKKNQKIEINLPNGRKYHGYAWNRSHLIADSLGGRAFRWNLITGTRMQNVGANDQNGGMQYIEKKVIEYLKFNKNDRVFYKAIPHYVGNELVPRVVEVLAYAESGNLDERVYTYNILPEYKIDYMNAEISKE